MASVDETNTEGDKGALPNYSIVKFADLPEESRSEIIDLVAGCLERYPTDLVAACKGIKELMERSYSTGWHIVAGESFSFDVTHDIKNCLYMFYNGCLGILLWKCE